MPILLIAVHAGAEAGFLLLVGAGLLILAGTLAPTHFPLLFGTEWVGTDVIVPWLAPWMLTRFIALPVSTVM